MAFCSACGKSVEAGSKFCRSCGVQLTAAVVEGTGSRGWYNDKRDPNIVIFLVLAFVALMFVSQIIRFFMN